mgnify:CR=1 FL=1
MEQYSITNEYGYEEDYSYLDDLLRLAIDKLGDDGFIIFVHMIVSEKMK